MSNVLRQLLISLFGGALLCSAAFAQSSTQLSDREAARSIAVVNPEPHYVDLVIALDVSGSMSGLIDSAKQRLWDVVNELGRAQPQPKLRVAILSYGDPSYGSENGYVRINQPFTSDLDAVNETLFSFSTNGGDEYVARVVDTSTRKLNWINKGNALKVLFVAGNEAADQDPQISVLSATHAAASQGIIVNTIYCGTEGDGLSAGWRDVAMSTNGLFASIDQNAAAVANVATPMDGELLQLNEKLNDTYVAYGKDGFRYRENQHAQDANASAMSPAAAASRAVAKASSLYEASDWDLVDAVKSGKALDDVAEADLPEPLREMSVAERESFVTQKSAERQALKSRIAELDGERRDYIKQEREARSPSEDAALDEVMQESLRTLAEQKGFTFE